MPSVDDDDWFADLLDSSTLNSKFVTKALLERQYLPHVKKSGEELPPIFDSTSFTEVAAEALSNDNVKEASWVEFRPRRFDGLVRRMGVPHPVPYSRLVLHIRDHWNELEPMLGGRRAQIRPEWHSDGRIIHMDYVDHADQHGRLTTLAHGKAYMVKADISNCFPSIYSHALDWALRTKPVAKSDRRPSSTAWEARLDTFARRCVNNETKGLLIGPAVSNLLSEIVLQRIDEDLATYEYVRFVDDYTAYFFTREDAERFLLELQRALGRFRLDLNTRKTRILSLREGIGDAWMAEIMSHIPADESDLAAARFLQHAELIAQRYPGQSVLKFAAKTLLGRSSRAEIGSLFVVDELVRVAHFHPHLLPLLSNEIGKLDKPDVFDRERLAEPLRRQVSRAVRGAVTDSILWLMYIVRSQLKRPLRLSRELVRDLIELDDDLVWVALATLDRSRRLAVARRARDLSYQDESDRQEHWLSRYELWRVGLLKTAELSAQERNWMRVLKGKAVMFSSALR